MSQNLHPESFQTVVDPIPPNSRHAMQQIGRLIVLVVLLSLTGHSVSPGVHLAASLQNAPSTSPTVLVIVNGDEITESDLEFLMVSRRISPEVRPKVRKRFLELSIDRRLMRKFLEGRNAKPNKELLDAQVARIHQVLRKVNENPAEILARLGYSEKRLREELALPLSWAVHVRRVVSNEQIRTYFQTHQEQFDGTEIRASQILLKVAKINSSAKDTALDRMKQIRQEIVSGKIDFATVARKYSQAPSREKGGDVGFFAYRGKMPESFTRIVFPLKGREVSEPFVTPFGVHLATVTDRKPGDFSLEDVRPIVFQQMSQELWTDTVRQERDKAQIEWKVDRE